MFGSSISLVPLRLALWSAFRHGSLCAVQVRPRQSGTSGGWVLVASFRQPARGVRFAAWAAAWLGCRCRTVAVAGVTQVSVGVQLSPAHCIPLGVTGRVLHVRGGVRGLARLVALLCGGAR